MAGPLSIIGYKTSLFQTLGGLNLGLVAYHEVLIFAQTCTSGNEVSNNDVFLHTLEVVALGVDRGFCEHLRGLLERCS